FSILRDALTRALEGKGSTWLVGGESGVGKSRLLDELRTQALVDGATVLRGQSIVEGGAPYLLWRDIVRNLCLNTKLSEAEASVLKLRFPDIAKLHTSSPELPDAPKLEPQAAQNRLLSVVETVFRHQTQPIVLLLEDLQWAGESLVILAHLNHMIAELP